MLFDTTRSNTGKLTAACISIQQRLGRELLWLPCRHHIGEIILTHTWKALDIESSTGPNINIFQRFKENFHLLNYKKNDVLYQPNIPKGYENLTQEIIQLCENAMKSKFCRGDYYELAVLTLVYLKGCSPEIITIQKPGALHKARLMAKFCIA